MWVHVTRWWNVYRNAWELSVTRGRFDFKPDEVWRKACVLHRPAVSFCPGRSIHDEPPELIRAES